MILKTAKLQRKLGKAEDEDTLRKRDSKLEAKQKSVVQAEKPKKKVKFNESQNEIVPDTSHERKWNDFKQNKAKMIQGKFQLSEIKALMNAICEYINLNRLTPDAMVSLCSQSSKELSNDHKKAWCKIAESIPNRSV